MPDRSYTWKRFWVPRGEAIKLDDGFLSDPDTRWGRLVNPKAVSLESVSDKPCLILLGDPGLGKSFAIRAESHSTAERLHGSVDHVAFFNLHDFGSENQLIRHVMEGQAVQSWLKGSGALYLFLDSLDEGLIQTKNLASVIANEFKERDFPIRRLYVRIACRAADWRTTFEGALVDLYGKDNVASYVLAPLRVVDVSEGARSEGLDPDAFVREVKRLGVVPFAIKPVTLRMLLKIYAKSGTFPQTQIELYREGCLQLCEPSEVRKELGAAGILSPGQLVAVAARIAALTTFSRRSAVWLGQYRVDAGQADITMLELAGGTEYFGGNEFEVSEVAIRETLATGLFTDQGRDRWGWSHQTYAEFLAASYLVGHKMKVAQMVSLIIHSGDPAGKVVPQLRETAAWLGAMDPSILRRIIETDPDMLLDSNLSTIDVANRERLVNVLLESLDEGTLMYGQVSHSDDVYEKLCYNGLADCLRPYVVDNLKNPAARKVAIRIAMACGITSLQNEILSLALDPSLDIYVRQDAVRAVGKLGDDQAKAALKPLAFGAGGPDPNDDLKGCALTALWPKHLTTTELFSAITPHRNPNYHGWYDMFLTSGFVNEIDGAGLAVALGWAEQQPSRSSIMGFERIIDAIVLRGWALAEAPGILDPLCKTLLSRLKKDNAIVRRGTSFDNLFGEPPVPSFEEQMQAEGDKRHRILEHMIQLLPDPSQVLSVLLPYKNPLVLREDLKWMLSRAEAAEAPEMQAKWAELSTYSFDWTDPDMVDDVDRARKNIFVAYAFRGFFRAVELDSDEARAAKANYEEQKEYEQGVNKQPLLDPPPASLVDNQLKLSESGDSSTWAAICNLLTLEPTSQHYGSTLEPDMTLLPGWRDADDSKKSRIVRAAKEYLLTGDPETQKWLGKGLQYGPALAGYKALALLLKQSPRDLESLSPGEWTRWSPVLLDYPLGGGRQEAEANRSLVTLAYRAAADAMIQPLLQLARSNLSPALARIEHCWDQRLSEALLQTARDPALIVSVLEDVLGRLLDHQVEEARVFAESLVAVAGATNDPNERSLAAATALVLHTPDAAWNIVWRAIRANKEFGLALVSRLSGSDEERRAVREHLEGEQLADLFIWLAEQFPYSQDPEIPMYGSPRSFRDSLLKELAGRGDLASYAVLEGVQRALPGLPMVDWYLRQARESARRNTWEPPTPTQVLQLATDGERRLVRNSHELMEAIIQSLWRLEAKLQGETPSAFDLWNDPTKGHEKVYTPKDEPSLSDYVKRHLDQDLRLSGVIINREVEVSRGEETDVYVQAQAADTEGTLSRPAGVIIEVKGDWNQDLYRAMQTQLADRYLKKYGTMHGIYLVGYFYCPKWSDDDYRKERSRSHAAFDRGREFETQAQELSKDGKEISSLILDCALH